MIFKNKLIRFKFIILNSISKLIIRFFRCSECNKKIITNNYDYKFTLGLNKYFNPEIRKPSAICRKCNGYKKDEKIKQKIIKYMIKNA